MSQTQVQTAPTNTAPPLTLPLAKYEQLPESKYDLAWADLVTLDLSQFDAPGGKQKLAVQLKDAVQKIGFFYITNFGFTQEQIDHQFAIGKELFQLPEEEKLKHRADLGNGNYNGYRPIGSIELFPGVRDNVEMYNVFKFLPQYERSHPDVIRAHYPEIEKFHRHIHEDIVRKLMTLIAIILEVPEDDFVNTHRYDSNSDCHLRYMVYRARTPEENEKCQNIWSRGHTDFGSLTLLFRQPVAALQIRMSDGNWKYVKPYPGSITVNIADVLQFWTNGFLKSSVHRVVAPPPDQANLDRLGVLYFLRPEDGLNLKTVNSPVLEREGYKTAGQETEGITAGDWVRARVKKNWEKAENRKDEISVLGNAKAKYYD